MTDELDTKLQAAVKPIRDKGGEHCSLADAIVDAIKALAEHLKPPNSTLPIAPTKAEDMLAKAGYEPIKPGTTSAA